MDVEKTSLILSMLENGQSLRAAAKEAGVAASTVLDWTKADAEFGEQYARAREAGYKLLAEEIVDISDEGCGDVNRDRLRVDTRKWMLSKMLPKIYGEKTQHEHTGNLSVSITQTENNL